MLWSDAHASGYDVRDLLTCDSSTHASNTFLHPTKPVRRAWHDRLAATLWSVARCRCDPRSGKPQTGIPGNPADHGCRLHRDCVSAAEPGQTRSRSGRSAGRSRQSRFGDPWLRSDADVSRAFRDGYRVVSMQKIGYPTEHIIRLAIGMVVCGMLGARLFFVIQNREYFFEAGASPIETFQRIFDMVGGGLVVYGSMIGALIAAAFVIWKWKLPVWLTADLIAPGMALGLAIGRIGCLLNGCCWGGVCDVPLPAIEFPAGSGAYMQQLHSGQLFGLDTESIPNEPGAYRVTNPGNGIGNDLGIGTGETIQITATPISDRLRYLVGTARADAAVVEIFGDRIGRAELSVKDLRLRSRGVHPTQIYSSINAFVLCLFLWFYWHVRRNDGEVMGLMLILYPISRFVLELIRNDESGQFGTELTISQWVSMLTIACGIGLFAYARMFGKKGRDSARSTSDLTAGIMRLCDFTHEDSKIR